MSPGAERVLGRAIEVARAGVTHPHTALIVAAEFEHGDEPQDMVRAFVAVRDAAGEPLTKWHEGRGRKPAETVALLEEALFNLQIGDG